MEHLNVSLNEDEHTGGAQLRKILDMMFPRSYITLYHLPPHSVCSLFNVKLARLNHEPIENYQHSKRQLVAPSVYQASSEPSSRARIAQLREHFNQSLVEHQAKPLGLCPIRRAIYDQCFDELIRQVTIGSIDQGLMLFKIRNELRMTLNYYKKIYESGVRFGLNKVVEAELRLEQSKFEVTENIWRKKSLNIESLATTFQHPREINSLDRIEKYYLGELERKDQIIAQQRGIIQALTNKCSTSVNSTTHQDC